MGPSLKGVSNRTSCQEKGKYDLDWETDLDEYHTPGVGHYAEVDVVEYVILHVALTHARCLSLLFYIIAHGSPSTDYH